MYVSQNYNSKIINKYTFSLLFIEALSVEISNANQKALIISVYRPPKTDIKLFIDKLAETINKAQKSYIEIIITGDFNINLMNYDSDNNVSEFLNTLASRSVTPVISKATRVSDSSATIIDNIFVSNPVNFTSGVLVTDISDHFPIFIVKHSFFIRQNIDQKVNISYRIINESTINNLCETLESHDFSTIIDSENCSASIDNLTKLINDSYQLCCPKINKTISYKNFTKPWIDDQIVKLIKLRQNYYILYCKKLISKEHYCKFRNYVTFKIRSAKKKYYEQVFNSVKNDIKKTWKIINNLLNSKRKKQITIQKVVENGVTYVDPYNMSNVFNDYFVNVGRNIAESVKCNPDDHRKFLPEINQQNSFFFKPIRPKEVYDIINSMKNKPTNIDTFSIKILKSVNHIISEPLADIINTSFSSKIFPDSLKEARVTPIFKEGDKCKINNYRPISVLPIFSKILEKAAYRQLYQYLETNSILIHNQFGFRRNKSTTQAIMNLTQYLYSNIDSGKIIFSMFLDFRKAFDSVNHQILLSKLNSYGVRGHALEWFSSYLGDRKQHVNINNTPSDVKFIKYGVPQGSILGPLLFLIFINDISNCTNFFKFILYADDSTLSTCIDTKNSQNHSSIINIELQKVYEWLNANCIAINEDKTKYMLFSYNKNISLPLLSRLQTFKSPPFLQSSLFLHP